MHALETENVLDLVARIRRASPEVPPIIGGLAAAAYSAPFAPAAIDAIVSTTAVSSVMNLFEPI